MTLVRAIISARTLSSRPEFLSRVRFDGINSTLSVLVDCPLRPVPDLAINNWDHVFRSITLKARFVPFFLNCAPIVEPSQRIASPDPHRSSNKIQFSKSTKFNKRMKTGFPVRALPGPKPKVMVYFRQVIQQGPKSGTRSSPRNGPGYRKMRAPWEFGSRKPSPLSLLSANLCLFIPGSCWCG